MLYQWIFHPLAAWKELRKQRAAAALHRLQSRYHTFRALLEDNNRAVSLLTDLGIKLRNASLDQNVKELADQLIDVTGELVDKLVRLRDGRGRAIIALHGRLTGSIEQLLKKIPPSRKTAPVIPLADLTDEMRGLAGGKALTLARLKRPALFRVPDGFVVPLSSCRHFLEQKNLYFRITGLLHPYLQGNIEIPENVEQEVVRHIMETPLPPSLATALAEAATPFLPETGGPGLAVRSSAVGEDGMQFSFAGQYRSILHVVTLNGVEKAFKEVVASSFSQRNIGYRLHAGLTPLDFDLAVLCLAMIKARSAGTLFTRDPNDPGSDRMLVSAVYGLGELAVSGSAMADIYRPDRDSGTDSAPEISRKKHRLVCLDEGGTGENDVEKAEQENAVLGPAQLKTLCQWGLAIEKMENCPQDMEWAIDQTEHPVLLQARPFRMAHRRSGPAPADDTRELILSGGVVASSGEGTGKAWHVRGRADLSNVPEEPYVLIMHQSLVDAVPTLRRAHGVIVDLGNPVDHLSCVAREYGVAMLTGFGNAFERLQREKWITVDAYRGRIVLPRLEDIEEARLLATTKTEFGEMPPTPSDPLAASLHKLIVPLNLTDAYGATFSIAECRTVHDLVRYVHEKAVIAMFEAGDETLKTSHGVVRHLESDIPFFFSVIDLGGGLLPHHGFRKWVKPVDIVSFPLQALWSGVADPKVNWGPPSGGVAMGSVISRFMTDHTSSRPIGMPNYAIITRDYLNLNARMDFHFIMLDSVCGLDSRSNYARFRFKGGGTSALRRNRRIQCISYILEALGFSCDVRDDLITADLKGAPRQVIEKKLGDLGRLLGFTRLLDAAMRSEETPIKAAKAFLAGEYQVATEILAEQKSNQSGDSQ